MNQELKQILDEFCEEVDGLEREGFKVQFLEEYKNAQQDTSNG